MSVPASVAVVIPAKDRASVLRDALTSVFAQTVRPEQVLVVDDGSTDATAEIARSFEGVTVLAHPEPRGSGPARNTGILAAETDWIAFLDSDDEWLPHHLEYLVAHRGEHVLVSSAGVDTNGRGWGNSSGRPVPLSPARCFVPETPIVTSAVMVNRRAILDAGLFGSFARAQDADMWARLLERGTGVALPLATVVYRVQSGLRDRGAIGRDQAGLREVMDSLATRPWMTRRVQQGVRSRLEWDTMRRALVEHEVGDAARAAAWLGTHPATWPNLVTMLAGRRRSRDPRWAQVLDRRPSRLAELASGAAAGAQSDA